MSLAEKIRLCRNQKGITQEQLANALNVSLDAVQEWENGTMPETDKIVAISNYFNISLDWLLKDTFYCRSNFQSTDSNNTKKIKNPIKISYRLILIFIIIGILATPWALLGSVLGATGNINSWCCLIMYAVTVPLSIFMLNKLKYTVKRKNVIIIGIITIILISVIGGILILCIDNSQLPMFKKEQSSEK